MQKPHAGTACGHWPPCSHTDILLRVEAQIFENSRIVNFLTPPLPSAWKACSEKSAACPVKGHPLAHPGLTGRSRIETTRDRPRDRPKTPLTHLARYFDTFYALRTFLTYFKGIFYALHAALIRDPLRASCSLRLRVLIITVITVLTHHFPQKVWSFSNTRVWNPWLA